MALRARRLSDQGSHRSNAWKRRAAAFLPPLQAARSLSKAGRSLLRPTRCISMCPSWHMLPASKVHRASRINAAARRGWR
jgi:hypothetical protein